MVRQAHHKTASPTPSLHAPRLNPPTAPKGGSQKKFVIVSRHAGVEKKDTDQNGRGRGLTEKGERQRRIKEGTLEKGQAKTTTEGHSHSRCAIAGHNPFLFFSLLDAVR